MNERKSDILDENTDEKQDALPAGTAKPQLYLLEYDRRFSVFEEFVYYDFQQPLKLPRKSSQTQIRAPHMRIYTSPKAMNGR